MEDTDVVTLVESVWNGVKKDNRREVISQIRKTIPSNLLNLFDCLIDNKAAGIQDNPEAKVLILLHGIQTDGAWQKLVQAELRESQNINVIDLGYECVTAAQLVGPFRKSPIAKITRDIRHIRKQEPHAKLLVIAHSFGSYILSKIICEHPDIEFERIILCGSIIPRNYEWDKHARGMRKESILNDVGTSDIWPIFATCASTGYGSSGRRGFQNASVTDRYFRYGHSDYFEPKKYHIKEYWKPFIETGRIVASDWDQNKGKTNFLILAMSHPWIGRPLLICLIIAIYFGVKWLIHFF